jgi:hypothetical protein
MAFSFMRLRSLQSAALLTLLAVPASLFAQTQISSNEEERLENLARSEAEYTGPKSSVTVGFRVLSSGVNVHFGNLGNVPFNALPLPATDGAVSRAYNNGIIRVDTPRAVELDSLGTQTSTPGGRDQTYPTTTTNVTDSAGNVIGTVTNTTPSGDFLSYTPGQTRSWSYASNDQAVFRNGNPYIAMSSYSATTDGGAKDKKQGISAGVELQFAHEMGKLSKRTQWSLMAGITLNGINNKTAGDVQATLHTITDLYSLNGLTAPATTPATPYTGPTYGDFTNSSGVVVTVGGKETTTPLASVPDASLRDQKAETGAATVHGQWQVKGAYFMMRVGPSVRAQITERFGLSASLGLAGAYAGTRYTAVESIAIPVIGGTISTALEESNSTKFLAGYFADFNLEWAANERTGLFGGVTAQKLGAYSQSLSGRTARIDLGSSVGLRGGVSIKF